MVNTSKTEVSLGESNPPQLVFHNDEVSVREGRYVGHDGFVVPKNFAEFYQRFPKYVANWVRRRVQGSVLAAEAEDLTQELLLHLAALSKESMHRKDGKEDVIQTFAPSRMHGANEARFRGFINLCLTNKFNSLYAKFRTRPLSHPGNLPLEMEAAEHGASDEFCHANSAHLRNTERRYTQRSEQRRRLLEFLRLAESSIPDLAKMVETFWMTGSWVETGERLGLSPRRFASVRRRLREFGAAGILRAK